MDRLPPGVDPSTVPLMRPPPGEHTNFVDPPSLAWAPLVSVYGSLPLMIIAVGLRMFVRLRHKQIGIDDYVLACCTAGAIAFNAMELVIYSDSSQGRHAWDLPVSSVSPEFLKKSVAANCIYSFTSMSAKLSLLVFYYRIFNPSKFAKIVIWVGMTVTSLFYLIMIITTLVYMIPRPGDGGWASSKNNARMAEPSSQILATLGVGSTVTDFYVFLVPLYLCQKIHMPIRRKIGVSCVFLTGILSIVCSIAGAVLRFNYLTSPINDNRWVGAKTQALATVEINIGVICCCVPVFFILFKKMYYRVETSLVRLTRLLPSNHDRRSAEQQNVGKDTGSPPPDLPAEIPRGIMTGLRSFMRRNPDGQSKKTDKPDGTEAVPSYIELQSIDYERFGRV